MATSLLTGNDSESTVHDQRIDFLTYLQDKFNDKEADAFCATFALVMERKNNEFCIDLDEAYQWMGFSRKDGAIRLINTLKLKREHDFLLHPSEEHRKPDKYLLKPATLKKLLLAARTDRAKQAAAYFIKIEETISEFYCESVSLPSSDCEIVEQEHAIRRVKTKSFPIEQFTLTMTNQNAIVSAGYHETRDPQVYAGIPQNVKLPPNVIPNDATIIKFGHTGDAAQRFEAHNSKYGEFKYIDHFYCVNAPGAEQKIRNFLIVKGRLIVGLRLDGKADHEFFYVTSQDEWLYFASEFKRICDELMQHYMGMERQRLAIQLAEAELAKEREKTLQEKEKTRRSEYETRARIAEAEARKEECSLKRLELTTKLHPRDCQVRACSEVSQDVGLTVPGKLIMSAPVPAPTTAIAPKNEKEEDVEAETDVDVEDEIEQVDVIDDPLLYSTPTQTGSHDPTQDFVSYGQEGRIAVRMIRAQLLETYLIEQLEARTLPTKIPLQTIVKRFNDWLAPPRPAPRRYHCQFSDRMFLNPMKAYERHGITKKKSERTRQYFIDHTKFRAKLVADGKISPLGPGDQSSLVGNDENTQAEGKARSYVNELVARKEKTRKDQEKRAKIVDEWLIHQLRVQELPSKILNSQMLQMFNEWLDLDKIDPRCRRYHRTFSRKMLPLPLLAYEHHGFARKTAFGGLEFHIDYVKLHAKFMADGKV